MGLVLALLSDHLRLRLRRIVFTMPRMEWQIMYVLSLPKVELWNLTVGKPLIIL